MSLKSAIDNLSSEEKRKISELIQTKEKNGHDSSTSWMYEQPKKNTEDFLLGKAIKSLEELAEISRDQDEETPAQRLTRLDMEAKFREDPLNLMRQHEYDKRSALLQNTARMKKLQRLQQKHAMEAKEKKKRKEKKKSKKKKKKKEEHKAKRHHTSSSSSESSDNSEDDAILDKFISIIRAADREKREAGEGADKTKEEGKKREKHHSKLRRKSHSPGSGLEPDSPVKNRDNRAPEACTSVKPSHDRGQTGSRDLHRRRRSRSRSSERPRHDRGSRRSRSREMPSRLHRPHPGRHEDAKPRGCRLTQEEMAALRAQMAADAKEREAERRERFEQHRAEKARSEIEELEGKLKHGASFLKGLTLDHVASSSVEEVVQRNAKSRQRGGMDENFLKR
ncbi:unnamed protein product [Mesocestoides corti]|uniref:CBF1-interacting co-repressor CIR N-terminal domain-containing protein n=1 Tax=Mesocestoides corti TaxID=53468 RepID=A0A158QTA6_MESCO|nr:unnamed protein product [Mesocestoides corti]